jgi:hypothetical protein
VASNSPFAGRTSGDASTNWPLPVPRRSPRRCWSASPRSTGSRWRSGGDLLTLAVSHARKRSLPILDALEPFLREKLQLISQKTKLAEAIRYTFSRWEGLCRFASDGRIEIDNNTVERFIRPLALTRTNVLFAGSDGGAGHWAVIASLIETCKLNGVDPQTYMAAVITLIVQSHPNSAIDDLMPWQFRPFDRLAAVA